VGSRPLRAEARNGDATEAGRQKGWIRWWAPPPPRWAARGRCECVDQLAVRGLWPLWACCSGCSTTSSLRACSGA
jgi:hypothetical protein